MTDAPVMERLSGHHADFLQFLTRRLRNRELAKDVLQQSFVRGMEHVHSLRDEENALAWFYRLLRNAAVDHIRKQQAEMSALGKFAQEMDVLLGGAEVASAVCRCVTGLIETLKVDQADILNTVDLQGVSVTAFAAANGITANNASVRLHRARQNLAKRLLLSCGTCCQQGCVECTCDQ